MRRLLLLLFLATLASAQYTADWASLDARPLPDWYDNAKFGIFCHWGAYSVPAFRSEWFWWYWQGETPDKDVVNFVNKNYPPGWSYADFVREFHAERFDANQFKDVIVASGAKYFVLTSKHHEGFTMWPSPTAWQWNAVDVGPKRDLIGELKKAFTGSPVEFGLYFSLLEWFHPYYKSGNISRYVEEVSWPQLHEIVNKYEPSVIWSDGDWGTTDVLWKSKEFLAWLYNESPIKDKVVVNDRWGTDCMGKHGGFLTYSDHYDPGKLLERKWENCMTLDTHSWGHRKDMTALDVNSVHTLIEQLARSVSCGGNFLLNVGPDQHGRIPPIFEDRLRELGAFLKPNEVALYGTTAAPVQNDTGNTWYTKRKDAGGTTLYAWILDTTTDTLQLKGIKARSDTKLSLPALPSAKVEWKDNNGYISINLASLPWRQLSRSDVVIIAITNPARTSRASRDRASWQEDYIAWLRTLKQKPRPRD